MKIRYILLIVTATLGFSVDASSKSMFDSVYSDGSKISSVTISADKESVSGVQRESLEKNHIIENLKEALMNALESKKRVSSDGTLRLDIIITRHRLRSEVNKVMFGIAAGSDVIEVDVLVLKDGVPNREFTAKGSDASSTTTVAKLIDVLKWDIVKKLEGFRLPKDYTPKREATSEFLEQEQNT